MNDLPLECRPPDEGVAARDKQSVSQNRIVLRCHRNGGYMSITLSLSDSETSHAGLAEPRRRLDDRVENRLQIESRAADDLQQVAGRGLVIERLLEIARARAHLREQTRVLDRDDRLVGKGAYQIDLPIRERLHPLASEE